ncbi:hypothetical protein A3Q56_05667, partial [Intoshia linei]
MNVTRWCSTAEMINRNSNAHKKINSVTLALQQTSTDMIDVRNIFKELVIQYSSMSRYLNEDSKIVLNKHFEKRVVKILDNHEHLLLKPELKAVKL